MPYVLAAIPFPSIDPVIFRAGPLAVRWYGVAYLLGFLLAYLGLRRMIRRGRLAITVDQVSDLLGWLVAGVVVGGRLGWWAFYHRAAGAAAEPWYEPLAVWRGGMSFHGGLVGVAAILCLWAWRRGVPVWNLADALALVAPVGLFLGRLANFVNAELVGRPIDVPWGVVFPGDAVARHPSQLYEALLEGPVLLALLGLLRRLTRPTGDGRVAAGFLVLYGLIRFAVEFTREPDEQLGFVAFGWLTMGQLLSAALAVLGVTLWATRARRGNPHVGGAGRGTGVVSLNRPSHAGRSGH